MIEVAMVFTRDGHPIFWLSPNGCTGGSVPDSHTMWDRIWRDRDIIGGVAHTHPWDGATGPSHTDLTTFAAIEAGLGTRLFWPIVTMTHVNYFTYLDEVRKYGEVQHVPFRDENHWFEVVKTLRQLSQSYGGKEDGR